MVEKNKIMDEDYILFETAILARAKGFDWHCDWRYDEQALGNPRINWKTYRVEEAFNGCEGYEYKSLARLKDHYYDTFDNNDIGWYVSAPTQAFLQKWLRKVHQSHITIFLWDENRIDAGYSFLIKNFKGNKRDIKGGWYESHEEALEMGLIQGLTLIKDKL